MPPHLPRPSICGVQAVLSSRTATSTTTTAGPLTWRTFSSTSTSAAPIPVPPESPRFIKLPEPPQSSEVKLPPVKGHLPVPRQVFSRRDGASPRRARPDYVDTIKPKSAAEQAGLAPINSREARHRLLAASRRKSLTEGLQGLWQRKQLQDRREKSKAEAHARKNIAAQLAPERLDEVLTRPSVRASTASNTRVLPDPGRFAAAERARRAHEEQLRLKSESRRDALSQLYMAASGFIVDEAELEAVVEQAFDKTSGSHGSTDGGVSIWSDGPPVNPTYGRAPDPWRGNDDRVKRLDGTTTTARQKQVSEALTGGKLFTETNHS